MPLQDTSKNGTTLLSDSGTNLSVTAICSDAGASTILVLEPRSATPWSDSDVAWELAPRRRNLSLSQLENGGLHLAKPATLNAGHVRELFFATRSISGIRDFVSFSTLSVMQEYLIT